MRKRKCCERLNHTIIKNSTTFKKKQFYDVDDNNDQRNENSNSYDNGDDSNDEELEARKFHDDDEELHSMRFHGVRKILKEFIITAIIQANTGWLHLVSEI